MPASEEWQAPQVGIRNPIVNRNVIVKFNGMFVCVCVAHFTEVARGSTALGAMLSDKSDNIARLRRDLNPRILIMHVPRPEYNP